MDVWTLENLIRTYKYIAIFSTVFFIIKFIMFSFIGGDHEISGDFDGFTDTDASFEFFSVQSILAFLMGFGWIGLAAFSQWHLPVLTTIIISSIVGFIFMFMSAYIMLKIKGLNQIVKINYEQCIGMTGKAYTTIQPKSEGQIEININGKLSIKKAINNTEEKIQSFEPVRVVKVEKEILYIEKT